MSTPGKHDPSPQRGDPATARPLSEEADIGSGEKTPGQTETEDQIRQIPPLPPGGATPPAKPH